MKASPKGKLQQEAWEQELTVLRERQKQARPLAARLQASTDRQAKSNKDLIEANAAAEELKVKLAAVEKHIEEIKVKVAEADAAVAACREEAAMGGAMVASTQMATMALSMIASTNIIDDATKATLLGSCSCFSARHRRPLQRRRHHHNRQA